jgi:serine/threonine protein phosphatase PrpC
MTDVGLKRQNNEDCILLDDELGLYVVCDGMGGGAAGEVASRTACDSIQAAVKEQADLWKAYGEDPLANRAGALEQSSAAVLSACKAVYDMANSDPARRGMGTTCAVAIVAGGSGIIAHVGDSRIYLHRKGRTHLLTHDHCLVTERLRSGEISPEEATKSRYAHVLTRNLGYQESVLVDRLSFELMAGDRYMLCSDGLSDYFEVSEIAKVFESTPAPEVSAAFVERAKIRGGKDNISCVVIEVAGEPDDSALHAEKKIEALQKIELFKTLNYVEMLKLLSVIITLEFKQGEQIIREGEESDRLYVILSGSVEVSKKGQKLATLQEGHFFGEMGLLDKSPRSADVFALEPTQLMTIPFEGFQALINQDPPISRKVLWAICEVLNQRLRATSQELSQVGDDLVEGVFGDNFINV